MGDARAVGESGRGAANDASGAAVTAGGDPPGEDVGRAPGVVQEDAVRVAAPVRGVVDARAEAPEVRTAVFGAVARRRRRGESRLGRGEPSANRALHRPREFLPGRLDAEVEVPGLVGVRARGNRGPELARVRVLDCGRVRGGVVALHAQAGQRIRVVRRILHGLGPGVSSESDRPSSSKSSAQEVSTSESESASTPRARDNLPAETRTTRDVPRRPTRAGSSRRRQRLVPRRRSGIFRRRVDFIGTTTSPLGTSQHPSPLGAFAPPSRSVRSIVFASSATSHARATSVAMPEETPSFVGAPFQPAPETPPRESRDDDVGTVEAFRDGETPATHPPRGFSRSFGDDANASSTRLTG